MNRILIWAGVPALAAVTALGALAYNQGSRSFSPAEDTRPSGWQEDDEEDPADRLPFRHDILLRSSSRDGVNVRKVSEDREFRSGERFKIAVTSRETGYLYVICRGSQGDTKLLFPYKNSPTHRIAADRRVSVPGQDWYRFDEEPGEENMYLVFSQRRIEPLERAARGNGAVDPRLLRQLNTRSKDIVVDDDENPGRVHIRRVVLQHSGE